MFKLWRSNEISIGIVMDYINIRKYTKITNIIMMVFLFIAVISMLYGVWSIFSIDERYGDNRIFLLPVFNYITAGLTIIKSVLSAFSAGLCTMIGLWTIKKHPKVNPGAYRLDSIVKIIINMIAIIPVVMIAIKIEWLIIAVLAIPRIAVVVLEIVVLCKTYRKNEVFINEIS